MDVVTREREVAEHRRGAATDPDEFAPKLARSLSSLAFALSQAERAEEALTAAEEAVAIARRSLVAGHVGVEHTLSSAVRNLVRAARATDQPARALAAIQQTSDVLRQLATADGGTYEAMFADHLRTYSGELLKVDLAAAVPLAEESAAIWRRRAAAGWDLDASLQNLQRCLEAAGRRDEAHAVYRERFASLTANSLLEEANFTIRTYNTLKRLDCHRLSETVRLTVLDLLYVPRDNRWVVRELHEKLGLVGLGPLQPGRLPEKARQPDLPKRTFGVLCVWCDAEDAVAQVREAVIAAYAADGVQPVDATTHMTLFAEGENGLDRELEINTADELGSDLVVVVREAGAWVEVYSALWELTPQGRHPLALRLSSWWPVLSVTATSDVAFEVCRYRDGALVQYAAHGRPAGPPPVVAHLDFAQLAGESWISTSAPELRGVFGDPGIFGNLVGLPSGGLGDLLDGWPIYDPHEGDESAVFLWRH